MIKEVIGQIVVWTIFVAVIFGASVAVGKTIHEIAELYTYIKVQRVELKVAEERHDDLHENNVPHRHLYEFLEHTRTEKE